MLFENCMKYDDSTLPDMGFKPPVNFTFMSLGIAPLLNERNNCEEIPTICPADLSRFL